jgi:hypothetical protein
MMKWKRNGTTGRRRGIVAVIVATALVAVVGVVAVTVDGGMLYLEMRRVRATADAAAMAAACDLFKNYPTYSGVDHANSAQNAALAVAASNGYPNGAPHTITVHIPPKSGTYTGKAGYAEVIVTTKVPRGFSRIWGTDDIPVIGRAVARGAWVTPNDGVLILNYQGKGTLNAQGNGAFTETGGPVIVNSNNSSALLDTGNGAMRAPEFDITGGTQLGGNASLTTAPVPNQIFLGTHPTPDPLAYLPEPDPTALPVGQMTTTKITGGTQYVLSPGVYTNLPTFTSGDVVIMQQASANNGGGIFYVNGGGFKSTGASITMDPNTSGGVMIYNSPTSTATSEKIQITGNSSGTVNLMPLSSGPYSGMSLWQDRNSPVNVLVEGNGAFTIDGTFYAPGALMNINGNGKTSTGSASGSYVDDNGNTVTGASRIGSQYISLDLSLGGNGNINIHYAGPVTAKTRVIALVE